MKLLLETKSTTISNFNSMVFVSESLTVKSMVSLLVTLVLELNSPFFILENSERFYESVIELAPEQETEIILGFDPPLQVNLVSEFYDQNLLITYREHPQKVSMNIWLGVQTTRT